MYRRTENGGVIDGNGVYHPPVVGNAGWDKFLVWVSNPMNVPIAATPDIQVEQPEPTVSEVIDALEAKDLGDTSKWDAVRARKQAIK